MAVLVEPIRLPGWVSTCVGPVQYESSAPSAQTMFSEPYIRPVQYLPLLGQLPAGGAGGGAPSGIVPSPPAGELLMAAALASTVAEVMPTSRAKVNSWSSST